MSHIIGRKRYLTPVHIFSFFIAHTHTHTHTGCSSQ